MTTPLLTDAHIRRLDAWEATCMPVEQTALTPRQDSRPPVVMLTGPKWNPPQPQPTGEAHWRGIVIGICLAGAFALAWKLLDVTPDALAILLGTVLGIGCTVVTVFVLAVVGERT